jgi:hypothetical protein
VLPGYSVELRAADSPGQDENDFELIAQKSSVGADETLTFETRAARYWLVWITDLPGGGAGRAEINEVTFFEP